jgi:nucleotide-binding universal stress UspA family protein
MRVMLATDGSENARAATEWLTLFPLPRDTRVLVLTVVTSARSPLDIPAARELDEALLASARRVADDARRVVAERWTGGDSRIVEGDARDRIVETAGEWRADLVVVGARGLGALKGFLLGSVSTAVVRDAPCPVLIVKGRRRAPRKIVLAVDGSADSLAAVRFLATLPLDRASAVRLLGVVEPRRYAPDPTEGLGEYLLAELDELIQRRTTELGGILTHAAEDFQQKVATLERSVVFGTAAEEIVSAANDPEVGLVVVGARGLGPVKRLLLGSVSEQVVHHAECPILIVRKR